MVLLISNLYGQDIYNRYPDEGCTVGVAAGRATSDGRPLVWKTRDSSAENNEVIFNTSFPIKFLSVVSAGDTYSWMGVNEKGFAIINSASLDLPGNWYDNGKIMRDATERGELESWRSGLNQVAGVIRIAHGRLPEPELEVERAELAVVREQFPPVDARGCAMMAQNKAREPPQTVEAAPELVQTQEARVQRSAGGLCGA